MVSVRPSRGGTVRKQSSWISIGLLLFAANASAQVIRGTVVEKVSLQPIREVGVVLLDQKNRTRMGALTDSLGNYRIVAPAAGSYRLSFQRIGLKPLQVATTLKPGDEAVLNVTLTQIAVTLTPVEVSEKGIVDRPPGNPHLYDEFLARRSLGFGHFLTRKDIEARNAQRTEQLFDNIPGLKVRSRGTQWFLQSQRCSGGSIPGFGGGFKLRPLIFIDGFLIPDTATVLLGEYKPDQIEAVEIYQGASEMPANAKGDGCFAIYLWLRH
jgi:hypothetical protein